MANAFFLLKAIYDISYYNHTDVDARWTDLAARVTAECGEDIGPALTRAHSIDIILRELETELLGIINSAGDETPALSVDILMALSDSWLLTSYEILRAMCQKTGDDKSGRAKFVDFHDRLELIRLPIAVGTIRGTDPGREEQHVYPLDEAAVRDNSIIHKEVCGETGAVIWFPIDRGARNTIPICRRDLSNEFLALYE